MIRKSELKMKFDLDCMDDEACLDMEDELVAVLHDYGWTCWAHGNDTVAEDGRPRTRDYAFRHCPDMECEHWDGHSGCDAPKTRCVRESNE